MSGQINLDSVAGQFIKLLSSQNDVNSIVEIGTWNGLGSTRCVLEGIKQKQDCTFISLESNRAMYDLAVKNNIGQNVSIVYGKIAHIEALDKSNLVGQESSWLEGDIADYNSCPDVYADLPDKIDLLILDGGEFSTREEFSMLRDRSNYIFLDDTKTRKNRDNREELLNSSEFVAMIDDPNSRNGWAVFKRR